MSMHRSLHFAVVLAFALLFAPLVHAVNTAGAELFRGKSTLILDRLIAKGVTRVKGFDIQELKRNAPQIVWKNLKAGESIPGFAGNRRSAFYEVKNKVVTIVADASDYSEELVALLSLHETLGALGVDDRHYQVSLGLGFMAYMKGDKETRALSGELFVVRTAGGGTSVGGGGDFRTLIIKIKMIGNMLRTQLMTPAERQRAVEIPLEPDYVGAGDQLRVSFDPKGKPIINVPVHIWNPERKEALALVSAMLGEALFTERANWKVNARIKCVGASKEIVFRWQDKMDPARLKPALENYFRGNKCTFRMVP